MNYLLDIAGGFWSVVTAMSPFLLLGFLVAGVLSVSVSRRLVERHLGGGGVWPVIKAALFGVPLPLCSCGVIPVSASLRRHGASRGATTSFLISTPQTGVDSIAVTFGLLGGVFALFRPLLALASGVVGGALVSLGARNGRAGQAPEAAPDGPDERPAGGPVRRAVVYGFYDLPRDSGKTLLIGLAVAALIGAVVPDDYFARFLPPGPGQMLVLMAAGIPVYVCATASVPIAAMLILKGISPGAALAFLMTGPATNAATVATVWKVLGRRTAAIYLAVVAGSALGGGLLLDQLVRPGAVRAAVQTSHWMLPGWLTTGAAVVLLGVIVLALVGPHLRARAGGADRPGPATRLCIRGMTCSHCAKTVRRALAEVPGVQSASVDLSAAEATIRPTGEGPDPARLRAAVEAVGYAVGDGDAR